ncbi:hypothetical protein AVDCRST_MAG94-787 [uncultured Leptolyngbya sp.]|uniref:Uncharacterized protein n=1 Tax=uncultured Leptolyngbya sp. TaxID=332963 RepID=A0A6J4KJK4_9CYAN|nr:hypothetical protein AVDCRST_MAG94-787 [uncultured Leptolyngbya sp.]
MDRRGGTATKFKNPHRILSPTTYKQKRREIPHWHTPAVVGPNKSLLQTKRNTKVFLQSRTLQIEEIVETYPLQFLQRVDVFFFFFKFNILNSLQRRYPSPKWMKNGG